MGGKRTGVEARANSLRVKLSHGGTTIRETLRVNGKPLTPTPANLRYAERTAATIRQRLEAGVYDPAEFFPDSKQVQAATAHTTLGALAKLWLTSKGRLAPATRDQYATAARFWERVLGPETPTAKLTHKLLAAKIGGYNWPSAKTHNNYLIALRGILALEYRGPQTASNPLIGIENMTVVNALPDPLTAAERDRVLADMRARYPTEVWAYFAWQFWTGMRPEETIALRWSDVDFQQMVVRVRRVRTFKGSERDGSKTHTERDVEIFGPAADALKAMRAITSMLVEERGDDTAADIFRNPVTKRPWHDERSQRDHYWRPALKRLGIRWRRAYATRHTFATAALMTGAVPPAYIAQQLGHSVQMLLTRYARWVVTSGDKAHSAALAAALCPGQTSPERPQARATGGS